MNLDIENDPMPPLVADAFEWLKRRYDKVQGENKGLREANQHLGQALKDAMDVFRHLMDERGRDATETRNWSTWSRILPEDLQAPPSQYSPPHTQH